MSIATDTVTTPSGRTVEGLVPGTWTIDTSHSEIGFVARHLMVSKVRGHFTQYDATVTIAPNVLDSKVEATVQLDSIETKDEKRDAHLRSEDFFHVEQHPTMSFVSTGIRENGSDFYLDGDLTIRGVTRPVTFDLEFNGAAAAPWGGAQRRLHRRDRDQPQGLGSGVERRSGVRWLPGQRQGQGHPRDRGPRPGPGRGRRSGLTH